MNVTPRQVHLVLKQALEDGTDEKLVEHVPRQRDEGFGWRYDGARARYLVRDLDPNDFMAGTVTVLSETWSDYDGDSLYDDFDPGSGSTMGSYQPGTWQSMGGSDDYLHGDMIGTLRMTTIGSGPSAGTPGLPRVFTAFGEKITGPQDRNGYAGAWGYQTNDATGGGTGTGGGVGIGFDFLHIGARYYDPSSGRFLQRDPIGIRGGKNVYAYVRNRPTTRTDPSGLRWEQTPGGIWVPGGTVAPGSAGPGFFGWPGLARVGTLCGIGGFAISAALVVKEIIDRDNADRDKNQGSEFELPQNPQNPWDWVQPGSSWEEQKERWEKDNPRFTAG